MNEGRGKRGQAEEDDDGIAAATIDRHLDGEVFAGIDDHRHALRRYGGERSGQNPGQHGRMLGEEGNKLLG